MANKMRTARANAGGFSLVEMLVAGGVLVVLGFGVIAIMSNSIDVWRTHETARDAYDRATAVLLTMENDIVNMATDVTREPLFEANLPPRARLLVGYDILGRPYLVFTKQMKDEMGNVVTRNSGHTGVTGGSPGYLTPTTATDGLRAFGNLEEIAYCFGPAPRYRVFTRNGREIDGELLQAEALEALFAGDDAAAAAVSGLSNGAYFSTVELVPNSPDVLSARPPELLGFGLYRGNLAPPPREFTGYDTGSLFRDFDLARMDEYTDAASNDGIGGWQREFVPSWRTKFQFFADGVLYVGYQVYTDGGPNGVTAWFPNELEQFDPFDPERDDCYFDSALGYRVGTNSRRGLGFPTEIRITVTVEALNGKPTRAELVRPLAPGDTEMMLSTTAGIPSPDGTHPVLLIGDGQSAYEWVTFDAISGRTVRGLRRGVRGTAAPATDYPAGTIVRWGLTLQKTIRLPITNAPPVAPAPPGVPRMLYARGWTMSETAGYSSSALWPDDDSADGSSSPAPLGSGSGGIGSGR